MIIQWPNPIDKIKYIWLGMLLVAFTIIARLFYLQVILTDMLSERGTKNFLRVEYIPSPRGNIIDCNGAFVATNRPTLDLYWQGTGNGTLSETQRQTLERLEKIIGTSIIENEELVHAIKRGEKSYKSLLLATDISYEALSKIEEQVGGSANIRIVTNFKRYYPFQSSASHIVGYLGTINFKTMGKMGLEQILEDRLQGEEGIALKTINSLGRHLEYKQMKQSLTGQNIQVTLDMRLQHMVESVFPADYTGTFILMDSDNGALLALLSRPDFDPALFLEHMKHDSWTKLQEKQPFLNRALNACYPPGSIFKLVTTCAALEHNIIKQDDCWYCKGYVNFANRQYWCARRTGHGFLSAEKALAHSCNTMFFEIGKKIDIDLIADYAHRFGLGKPTNVIFSEKTGIIPSKKWKRETKHERWWPGETLSASIGQSFLLVTPLQVARMIASIFTGYLITPRILYNEPIYKEPLAVSTESRIFLQNSMRLTVKEGTGQKVNMRDFEIYAKTSTAQTSAYDKRLLGSMYLEHGWFVGHFSYKNSKPLTLVILVEHAGTSRVPTEIAKKFLISYKKFIDQLNAGIQ